MPQNNKTARATYDKAYRENNKESRGAKQAQWRADNADHLQSKNAKRRLTKRAQCLINGARTRSKAKGVLFELDDFEAVLQARIDAGVCELSGFPFDLSPGRKANSPSLDRIDPSLGYVPSNVRVICHALNAALGDWGETSLAPITAAWLSKRASLSNQFADLA